MAWNRERIRYELKYPVQFAQGRQLVADLASYLVPDTHGENGSYVVYSVYFDTRGLNLYQEKLDGFTGRVKYRLRTYLGSPNPQWFLESKERVRQYGSKHRIPLSPEKAQELIATHLSPATLEGLVPPDHPLGISLSKITKYGVLLPTVATYYHRSAYIFKGARDVRVTLDHNLIALPAGRPPGVLPVHHRDRLLVEIKGNGWMPVEVVNAICRNNLVARTFSKYCACVEQLYRSPRRVS